MECVHAGKVERTCVPRDKHVFNDFLYFLKLDMKSRGIRLDKEDNMTIDGAILTADSHGDKFQCNTWIHSLIMKKWKKERE